MWNFEIVHRKCASIVWVYKVKEKTKMQSEQCASLIRVVSTIFLLFICFFLLFCALIRFKKIISVRFVETDREVNWRKKETHTNSRTEYIAHLILAWLMFYFISAIFGFDISTNCCSFFVNCKKKTHKFKFANEQG